MNPRADNHKLVSPLPIAGAIERSHLVAAALASASHRVVFVQAPAGHGKTTLLLQLMAALQARGAATGWITLDEGDDDPTRFMSQFLALIGAAIGVGDEAAGAAGTSGGGFGTVDDVLRLLALSERQVVLLLDEFQVIRNVVVTSFVGRLAARLPPHVTLCIGSRSLAAIGLGRLVMRGTGCVLKTSDLRFTRQETASFFAGSLDPTADAAVLDELHTRTEGWPAALQLARLALAGGAGKGVVELLGFSLEPEFEEYLADNVLSAQSADVREFLLRTSVLERFSPALCDALCGRTDSERMLGVLERSGLFVRPVGVERQWFRYHSLFSSYLRKQLRLRQPALSAELHRGAAEWFLAAGYAEDAIQHAVAAADFGLAATILESWSNQLVREARLATIERWLDMLPVEEVRRRPALQMKVLWALLFLRRFHRARPLLDALLHGLAQGELGETRTTTLPLLVSVRHLMEDDIPAAGRAVIALDVERGANDDFESFELGAIANIQSLYLRTLGDFASAERKAMLGRAHSETGHAVFSGAYAMAFLGNAYMAQARLNDALATYRRAYDTASRLPGSYASAVAAACYAEALYYVDQVTDARTLLEDALPLISQACMPDALAVAHITLSKILLLADAGVDAAHVLGEAERIGNAAGLPRVVRMVNWERVRQLLMRDDVEEAEELAAHIAADGGPAEEAHVFHAAELDGDAIGAVRLLVYRGQTEAALRELARLQDDPRYARRRLRWLKLRMLQALALANAGHAHAACEAMHTVMRHAVPERLARFVMEEAGFFAALERTVGDVDPGSEREVVFLRSACEKLFGNRVRIGQASGAEMSALHELLTEREVDILRMLSRGSVNREIGASLFVSENTVRYHLRNIYSKLGVKNRTEASNFALRHGLVE